MGSRPYHSRKVRKENRKQRKSRWIDAKNLMRKYPDCAFDGDIYCNHLLDPEHPSAWVDFTFFHTKLKKYFSVAMTCLWYDLQEKNDDRVSEELDKTHPYPEGSGMIFGPIDKKTGFGRVEFTQEWTAAYNVREPLRKQMLLELNREAQRCSPKVDVKDYGKVAVGLWVSLDVPHIDKQVIQNFVAFYRSIGEPITPGRAWTGEEVEVVPERTPNAK